MSQFIGRKNQSWRYCSQNIRLWLVWPLLLGLILSCKPEGGTLEPITGSRADSGSQSPEREAAFDPESIIAKLSNVPEGDSPDIEIEVTVSGDQLTHYSYKVGPALTTECELAHDYVMKAIDEPISHSIEMLPDGQISLCVVGKHASGFWQPYELASVGNWRKATDALESPENLLAIPASERISLAWERPQEEYDFLLVRSTQPIDWQPSSGEAYEPGNLDENLDIVYAGDLVSYVDMDLTDFQSYHYAVYSYDLSYRYSPPATIAAIPSQEPYVWLRNTPGAFFRDAVIAGRRYDNSRNLYVCRVSHVEQGVSYGFHVGKFVPVADGDLSSGDCYYTFGAEEVRERENYEVLVITRGRFEDWFQWAPFGAQFPLIAFVAGIALTPDEEVNIYVCRFLQDEQHFVPGKAAPGLPGCEADVYALDPNQRGYRNEESDFEILLRRSL